MKGIERGGCKNICACVLDSKVYIVAAQLKEAAVVWKYPPSFKSRNFRQYMHPLLNSIIVNELHM